MSSISKIDPVTEHLPLRLNSDLHAMAEMDTARNFLLVPLSIADQLTEINNLISIRATPLCYQSSIEGPASHLLLELPDFHSQWQHWLRVHQQATRFIELTFAQSELRVLVEAGYQINFDLTALVELSGAVLLLRGNGHHLIVSSLAETRALLSMLRPSLALGDQSIGWHALPSIDLRLQPRARPAQSISSAALLLTSNGEMAALQRWVMRAPSPFLSALRIYQDSQRVIIFNNNGEQLPPLACGQLLLEWCRANISRILVPHQMELAPALPASVLINALNIKADHIGLLFYQDNQTQQLEIAMKELTPIRRAVFKPIS